MLVLGTAGCVFKLCSRVLEIDGVGQSRGIDGIGAVGTNMAEVLGTWLGLC